MTETTDLPDIVPVPKLVFEGLTKCATFVSELMRDAHGNTDPTSLFLLALAEKHGLRDSRPITDAELNDPEFLRQMSGIDGSATVKTHSPEFMAVLEAVVLDEEPPAGEQEAAE